MTDIPKSDGHLNGQSRWHLARNADEAALTGFESSLERVIHAYRRWKSDCLAAVRDASNATEDFSGNDTAVLNVIRMKDRAKGLSEISRLLNRDDTPNIQYSLRKLLKAALIEKTEAASRKGTSYRVTALGQRVTDAYAELRADLLLTLMGPIENRADDFADAEQFLNLMTSMYDQASKQAAAQRY